MIPTACARSEGHEDHMGLGQLQLNLEFNWRSTKVRYYLLSFKNMKNRLEFNYRCNRTGERVKSMPESKANFRTGGYRSRIILVVGHCMQDRLFFSEKIYCLAYL